MSQTSAAPLSTIAQLISTPLPELVAEHKAYADELYMALTDPGD